MIVERAVAFLFGHPVKVTCATENDGQAAAFEAVKRTLSENKIDSLNRRIARCVMSETEAAELWYPVDEKGFWERVGRNEKYSFVTEIPSKHKLRVAVFSPSQGDLLFPMFDSYGDMTAFSREYAIVRDGEEKRYFETYTDEQIVRFEYTGAGWQEISRAGNALGKIPVVYACQGKASGRTYRG